MVIENYVKFRDQGGKIKLLTVESFVKELKSRIDENADNLSQSTKYGYICALDDLMKMIADVFNPE